MLCELNQCFILSTELKKGKGALPGGFGYLPLPSLVVFLGFYMAIGGLLGIKRSIFLIVMLFSPTCVLAVINDGFQQTGPHQAVAMRRLMAPHSYGVLVVAEGNRPRFAALASNTTEANCLARHAIRVDGVVLLVTPRFYAKEGKRGLCELWLKEGADQDFFANRLKNDHFIQIDGHDINVKNYHLNWQRISRHAQ